MITQEFETCNLPGAIDFCKTALIKGNLLILIDGIDELPDDQEASRISEIKDYVDKYPQNRYIITRRKAVQSSFTSRFKDVYIAEFSKADFINFIRKWSALKAYPPHLERRFERAAEKYIFRDICQIPLLVIFLCLKLEKTLYKSTNEAAIYAEIVRLLLTGWPLEKGLINSREEFYEKNVKQEVISRIAYKMAVNNRVFIFENEVMEIIKKLNENALQNFSEVKIVDDLEYSHGLLSRQADGTCTFPLPSIKEYLTAHYINHHEIEIEGIIEEKLTSPEWKRIITLLCGMDRSDKLLENIFNHLKRSLQSRRVRALIDWSRKSTIDPDGSGIKSIYMGQALFICFELFSLYALQSPYKTSIFNCNTKVRQIISKLDQSLEIHHLIDPKIIPAIDTKVLVGISIYILQGIKGQDIFDASIDLSRLEKKLHIMYSNTNMERMNGKNRIICMNYIYALWINTLKIDPDHLEFTWHDIKQLKNYLSGYQFLLQCREKSTDLSAHTWLMIEDELFSLQPN